MTEPEDPKGFRIRYSREKRNAATPTPWWGNMIGLAIICATAVACGYGWLAYH